MLAKRKVYTPTTPKLRPLTDAEHKQRMDTPNKARTRQPFVWGTFAYRPEPDQPPVQTPNRTLLRHEQLPNIDDGVLFGLGSDDPRADHDHSSDFVWDDRAGRWVYVRQSEQNQNNDPNINQTVLCRRVHPTKPERKHRNGSVSVRYQYGTYNRLTGEFVLRSAPEPLNRGNLLTDRGLSGDLPQFTGDWRTDAELCSVLVQTPDDVRKLLADQATYNAAVRTAVRRLVRKAGRPSQDTEHQANTAVNDLSVFGLCLLGKRGDTCGLNKALPHPTPLFRVVNRTALWVRSKDARHPPANPYRTVGQHWSKARMDTELPEMPNISPTTRKAISSGLGWEFRESAQTFAKRTGQFEPNDWRTTCRDRQRSEFVQELDRICADLTPTEQAVLRLTIRGAGKRLVGSALEMTPQNVGQILKRLGPTIAERLA